MEALSFSSCVSVSGKLPMIQPIAAEKLSHTGKVMGTKRVGGSVLNWLQLHTPWKDIMAPSLVIRRIPHPENAQEYAASP